MDIHIGSRAFGLRPWLIIIKVGQTPMKEKLVRGCILNSVAFVSVKNI
jgi:hypothetical protein